MERIVFDVHNECITITQGAVSGEFVRGIRGDHYLSASKDIQS